MARPPLPLGHHGTIKVTRDNGQWVARCRVRDLDGVTCRVARWGSSRTAAQRALQDELRLSECDVAQIDAFFSRLERARRTVEHEDGSTTEPGSTAPVVEFGVS